MLDEVKSDFHLTILDASYVEKRAQARGSMLVENRVSCGGTLSAVRHRQLTKCIWCQSRGRACIEIHTAIETSTHQGEL